ncbi:MAG: TlyA family RNA methyltransferase [Nitrospira sp.]|nr:TlyA family RNA methyltransferase [Nitrospira sp.]
MAKRQRLDQELVSRGLVANREQAHRYILAGRVSVDGVIVDKRAKLVERASTVNLNLPRTTYVSRAGEKLAAALDFFDIHCAEKVAMDVGASTGGFTDCLLQNGVAKVYAIDVGYGQLDWKLREDPRVLVHERCNIRYLSKEDIHDQIELAVIDVSFISLRIVLPSVLKFLGKAASIVMLVKPQFEVGKGQVGRGGIVREDDKRAQVKDELIAFAKTLGLSVMGMMDSPVLGRKGNREMLMAVNTRPEP